MDRFIDMALGVLAGGLITIAAMAVLTAISM